VGAGRQTGVQHGGVLEQTVQVHAQHIARRVLPGHAGHDLARHVALGGHGGCWAVWPWWIS
jgi:hypothetical protein